MSILTRSRRPNTISVKSQATPPAPAAPVRRPEEAPERAADSYEAPEDGRARGTEAPDAGSGRHSFLEHEFTHGRSQS